MRFKNIYLTLVIIMMAVIFIHSAMQADLSLQESSGPAALLAKLLSLDPDSATTIVRKCGHFLEYLILGVLLFLWLSAAGSRHAWAAALIIGIVYAVTDEIHQLFVPGRSCEVRDIFIDAAGVAAGVLVSYLVRTGSSRKKQN